MPTLLSLEVSPRGDRSISRALGKVFRRTLEAKQPRWAGSLSRSERIANSLHGQRLDCRCVRSSRSAENTRDAAGPRPVCRTDRRTSGCRGFAHQHTDVQLHHSGGAQILNRLCHSSRLHLSPRAWLAGNCSRTKGPGSLWFRGIPTRRESSETADLVTPVLRQAFGFMGIHDVDVVRAGGSLAVNLGKVRLEDHLEVVGDRNGGRRDEDGHHQKYVRAMGAHYWRIVGYRSGVCPPGGGLGNKRGSCGQA